MNPFCDLDYETLGFQATLGDSPPQGLSAADTAAWLRGYQAMKDEQWERIMEDCESNC